MNYTVGADKRLENWSWWYVQLPWSQYAELPKLIAEAEADQLELVHSRCAGIEFRDGHVQFHRHTFPWAPIV